MFSYFLLGCRVFFIYLFTFFFLKPVENPQSYLVTEVFFLLPLQNVDLISLNVLSL